MSKYKPKKASGRRVMRMVMLLCMTVFGSYGLSVAHLQEIVVNGTVTDRQGEPIAGAIVSLKGNNRVTTTNESGAYSIQLPDGNGTLVFTYIGYGTQEVAVAGRSTIDVQLESTNEALSEVVVVGYGTQTKASITGAVSTIQSEDLVRTPAVAATSALVGKVPGVTARTTDSRPGNGANIQVRNLGNPLYVIDGVPYSTNDQSTAFGFNTGVSGQNVFNNLGLEDIESITVLKDASASVYGLRASNGVVLITTKKGRKGEHTSINVTSYYGMQNLTRFPRPANSGPQCRGLLA